MQAHAEKNSAAHLRIRELIDHAASHSGGYSKLAERLEVSPQLVSNWRTGIKTPSPEAQTEIAVLGNVDPMVTALMAMIEKSDGNRKSRLQQAYRQWSKEAAARITESVKSSLRALFDVAAKHGKRAVANRRRRIQHA